MDDSGGRGGLWPRTRHPGIPTRHKGSAIKAIAGYSRDLCRGF
jgi:hypothetical protein